MGDYDYCQRHDCSFLMPDLLECPFCAVEKMVKYEDTKLSDEELEGCKSLLEAWHRLKGLEK